MIKGLYAAASAMVVNSSRQRVLSHNIANIDTPGFKQILTKNEEFLDAEVTYSPGNLLNSSLENIGAVGLGVQSGAETIDFSQGGLQKTESLFDFAIVGDGLFRVKTPAGERFTRDGRFLRDAENNLVTIDGFFVLNENGEAIKLPVGDIAVAKNGTVMADGKSVARIGLAVFENPEVNLKHDQGNYFIGQANGSKDKDGGIILQSHLESSNANVNQLMTQLVEISRSYEAAQKMIQNEDELTGRAIATLGRIA